MLEMKTIKNLRWLWIILCLLIAFLTVLFPMQSRSVEVNICMFVLTGLAFFMTWFLIGVFLFSTVGSSIIRSMPTNYRGKYFKYLFFLKFFMAKEAYQEVQIFLNETNSHGS